MWVNLECGRPKARKLSGVKRRVLEVHEGMEQEQSPVNWSYRNVGTVCTVVGLELIRWSMEQRVAGAKT